MKQLQYVLAGVAVGVVILAAAIFAYDRGPSRDDSPTGYRVAFSADGSYSARVAGWPTLRIDPGRQGCETYGPDKLVCDLSVAFPDLGLTGRVLFDRA